MEQTNEICTVEFGKTLNVRCYTEDRQGFVLLSDGLTTHTLDLVAVRRLAIALLCAAEDAEPIEDGNDV